MLSMAKRKMPLFAVLALLLVAACSGRRETPAPAPGGNDEAPVYTGPAWQALALLKSGENPLWFELTPEGPRLVTSPAEAALAPFNPWPHARYITGILPWKEFIVMAVNRDGFLALAAETAGIYLYRAADSSWDTYTTESFFIFENKPAVLLYRNDFFSELKAEVLKGQVYVLDESSAFPVTASIPFLEKFAPPWEAEIVRMGPDGFWYFRMKEKGKARNETAYFRVPDLAGEGEKVSISAWRNSDNPEILPVSSPLGAILGRAQGRALTVSPDFEGERLFAAPGSIAQAVDGEMAAMSGYCREKPEPLALAVFSGGQGFFSRGAERAVGQFSLPVLPEGFAYTHIALLGNVLAASWEEQQGAAIGAAGFMVMNLEAVIK